MRNLIISILLLAALGYLLMDIYKKRTLPVGNSSIVSVVVPNSGGLATTTTIVDPSTLNSSSFSSSSASNLVLVQNEASSSNTTSFSSFSSSSSSSSIDNTNLYNSLQQISNLAAGTQSENGITLNGVQTTLSPTSKIFITNDRKIAYIVSNNIIIKKIIAPGEKQFTKVGSDGNSITLGQLDTLTSGDLSISLYKYDTKSGELLSNTNFNVPASDVDSIK